MNVASSIKSSLIVILQGKAVQQNAGCSPCWLQKKAHCVWRMDPPADSYNGVNDRNQNLILTKQKKRHRDVYVAHLYSSAESQRLKVTTTHIE